MTTMADGGRCVSDLPDDLLRHILFFTPAMEGAATALLSRRWRWLWRTSGAINLYSRSFKHPRSSHTPFLHGAEKALAAAKDPIRRLTLFIAEVSQINLPRRRRHEYGSASSWDHRNLIDALVSNPAVRCVEELHIEVEPGDTSACMLSFCSLRSESLRVLRIVNCASKKAPPPAAFPQLAALHLHGCVVCIEDLRSTIAAAPKLSTLLLESCYLYPVRDKSPRHDDGDEEQRCRRQFDVDLVSVCCTVVCPAVTALVFAKCRFGFAYGRHGTPRLEIHLQVPRLQYFRYEGSVVPATQCANFSGDSFRVSTPHKALEPQTGLAHG